ncbi:hypothetical protein GQ457_02G020780 [Hibiscus cannabinus]
MAFMCAECRFGHISSLDTDLMITGQKIELRKEPSMTEFVKEFIGSRNREFSENQNAVINILAFVAARQVEKVDPLLAWLNSEFAFLVDKWGLVDVDIADLKVQIASATVLLGLSRRSSFFDRGELEATKSFLY